ncbi:helix-turn-helix domain-containing protein [Phytohabitans aurantiacus]|nr:helix-turn-helix domain-containing protein [Phytohabitans aurantiacus]
MAKPYERSRRALLNKPGVFLAAGQPARDILGHVTGAPSSVPAAGGQSYVERPPAPALRELLSSVWVQQVEPDAAPYVHRRIPNGAVELVCTVGAAPQVIGPLTEPLLEILKPGTTIVGLRFVPGAFPVVAGQPASEVAGLTLNAEQLWGRSAAALGEAVGTAASPQEALAAVQLYAQERASAGQPRDPLVSEAVRGLMPWRTVDVTSLRASLHISETQLRRRCRTAIGLAPKALQRMLRFQGFLALVQQAIAQGRPATDDGLGLLALRTGYADQSHLTRECVRLTGVSPRIFIAETQRACACGHDHSASFAPVLRAETETRPTRA